MANSNSKITLTFTALDKASASMKRIHDNLDRVNKPLRNFKSTAGNLLKNGLGMGRVAEEVRGLGDGLLGVARNVAVLGGAAYGAYRFAEGAVSAADAVGDLKDQTGAGARDIQVYGSLVELAGGSSEDAATSIGKLQKSIALAIRGSKEHVKAFRAVGLSVSDLKKMSPDEVLQRIADAYAKSGKQGEKLLNAQTLMGKSSAAMVSVLNKGSAAIREHGAAMAADGALISDDDVDAADRLDGGMSRLKRTLGGLRNSLGLSLAKALEPFINKFQRYLVDNKGILQAKWVRFLEVQLPVIIDGATVAFGVLGRVLLTVANVFSWLSNTLGKTGTTFVVLTIVLAPLIASLLSIGGALISLGVTALPWVIRGFSALSVVARLAFAALGSLWRLMLANPFVALAAAVVFLGVVIFKNWDKIVAYVQGAWERIKAAFGDGFFTGMFTLWLEGWKAFGNAILGIVKAVIPDALMPEWLKNFSFGGATPATKPTATPAVPSAPAGAAAQPVDGAAVAASMRANAAPAAIPGLGGKLGRLELVVSDDRVRARLVGGPLLDLDVYNGRNMAGT